MNADGMDILKRYRDDVSTLSVVQAHLEHLISADINENQRAALESLIMCRGAGILRTHRLRSMVNQISDDCPQAVFYSADYFLDPEFTIKNDRPNKRLEDRRKLEAALFLKPILIARNK